MNFMRSNKSSNKIQSLSSSPLIIEDLDVLQERARIEDQMNKHSINNDLLTIHHLTKQFNVDKNQNHLTAVDSLTFGIHHEECFGLLGVNGAGKTTTFSMLTGDLLPTSGDAYINNINSSRYQYHKFYDSLINNMRQFQQSIGYCPQFDALLTKLTGTEMLYLFGRLRGIPKANLDRDVHNLIKMTSLGAHAGHQIDSYSGGTRRKLSIAIALIGSPPLLLLDEPTSGVDPVARRKIWQTLEYLKRHFATSIVLTSHSMEECEALCSRIGIMVNGKFCCIGSPQHLRSKYGQGYWVTISLKRNISQSYGSVDDLKTRQIHIQNEINKIQLAIISVLPSAVLKDSHQSLMLFHITDPMEKWSNIFRQMSHLDEQFNFEDYHVSDTTLEQIFIMFSRHKMILNGDNVNDNVVCDNDDH